MKHFYALFMAIALAFASPAWAASININTADAETIQQELTGIGRVRAEAIVDYRQQHGAFLSADELLNVTGIGEYILEANRENILLGRPES